MKRTCTWIALVVAAALAATPMLADVKTQQKTTARIEGILGTFMNGRLGNGTVSTVSVKGNRMSRVDDKGQMQIIDLTEQKIYIVDVKGKSYKVMTFAEMRKGMEDAAKAMQDQAKNMSQQDKDALADASKQIETDAEVKETGQHKTIAGKETREAIVTITTHEKGKKIEDSGGFILQNDMWLGDVASLNEMVDFQQRYFKAVFEGTFTGTDIQQTSTFGALFPGFMKLSERLAAESKKLRGTSLASTMVFGTVKAGSSAEQVRQQLSQPPPQGGGGLRGLGRMMSGQNSASSTGFSRFLTTGNELLSVGNAVTPADIEIPAGFKEKK